MLIDGDKVCSSANPPAGLIVASRERSHRAGIRQRPGNHFLASQPRIPRRSACCPVYCLPWMSIIHPLKRTVSTLPAHHLRRDSAGSSRQSRPRTAAWSEPERCCSWRRNRGERRVQIYSRKFRNCHHLCKQALQKHVRITKYGANMQIFVFA